MFALLLILLKSSGTFTVLKAQIDINKRDQKGSPQGRLLQPKQTKPNWSLSDR